MRHKILSLLAFVLGAFCFGGCQSVNEEPISIHVQDEQKIYSVGETYNLVNHLHIDAFYKNKDSLITNDYVIRSSDFDPYIPFKESGVYSLFVEYQNIKSNIIHIQVTNANIEAEKLLLSKHELYLKVGTSKAIDYSLIPLGATSDVSWFSDDSNIVSVDNGLIKAHKNGMTYVYASSDNGINDKCFVVVSPSTVFATDIKASKNLITLYEGEQADLSIEVEPINHSNTLNWYSEDEMVAKVFNGNVYGISPGETTIVATVDALKASIDVIIKEKKDFLENQWSLVESYDDLIVGDQYIIADSECSYIAGNILSVSMRAIPASFSSGNKTIIGLSDDTCILTLKSKDRFYSFCNEKGSYLGHDTLNNLAWDKGNTKWNIILNDGLSIQSKEDDKLFLQFYSPQPRFKTYSTKQNAIKLYHKSKEYISPHKIEFLSPNIDICVGDSYKSEIKYYPNNINDSSLSFISSNPHIASVSTNGIIFGFNEGSSIVYAFDFDKKGNEIVAKCIVNVRNVPVSSISLDEELINLKIGSNKKLVSHILPSNASNKEVKWESSNSSVALVSSNGVVTGLKEGETVISVSTFDGNKRYECKVIVNGFQLDSWTIMIYMCGSTLESDPSYKHAATSDLQEICSIDKPNDVNVIVEAGGASRWGNTFSYVLDSNHINRFHLENDYYALDAKLPQANMGDSQTLESFMDWGLSKYPAERTMVILWNHGGGLNGVCFDDRYDSGNDSLLNSEVDKAMNNVFNARSYQNKLEVIGYDACLMQVMDIAEYNSHYFNYMIASQEAENDGGWDYDVWLPTLYNNNSAASIKTEKVLTSICDSFINDNGGVYGIDYQTMSWLDLSKMNSFYQSFEEMSSYMDGTILNSSNRGTFANLVKKVKNFGDDNYSDYYVDYCLFDVVDLLHKMSANSSFNKELMNTYIDTCLLNVKQLIGYNISQRSAGESFGLCCFYSVVSSSEQKDVYLQSETHFINWRSLSMKYGF